MKAHEGDLDQSMTNYNLHTISGGVVIGWSRTIRRSTSLTSCPIKLIISVLSKSTHGRIEIAIKG